MHWFALGDPTQQTYCFVFLQVDFEDVYMEQKNTKIFPPLYRILGLIYKYTKLILYHILVVIFGIPLMILAALINGGLVFLLVWVWGPMLRMALISLLAVIPIITVPYVAFYSPIADVVARIFRQCRFRVDLNSALGRNLPGGQEHTA